jgi:WhiB family transcriptional regulator, redox-sensing transcriptional regulator
MSDTTRLPGPVSETWDWQRHGSCRGMDSARFFHPDAERGQARARRVAQAKEICNACPVIAACREHALTVIEPYGIWGGLDEAERRAVYAQRRLVAVG